MEPTIDKIPGGFALDGLPLRNGRCGCSSFLPCCSSWSKVKRNGNDFQFTVKVSFPEAKDTFAWGYKVKKGSITIEVKVDDARDKQLFSGYYPPLLDEFIQRGWEVVGRNGEREDFGLWRCAACKWLYKNSQDGIRFQELPADWKCPVCNVGKEVFDEVG